MCKASKYVGELERLISSINADFNKLSQKQAEYDTKLSEYYHKIEQATFNACEGYYLTKELQELLRKRRVIKDEFFRLNTLKQTLQIGQLHASVSKTKNSIHSSKQKATKWQQDWKNTYSLEELLH